MVTNTIKFITTTTTSSTSMYLLSIKVSIMKPNGTIYANSQDDYLVDHLEYEAFNRMYLKVITNKYFDKGEFFAGDSVNFRAFKVNTINNNTTRSLENFMNRSEGHEIVEIGQPNDAGYYKTFYILAPGVLDQAIGRVTLDDDVIAFIVANRDMTGHIMNATLQPVISMTAKLAS